MSTDTRELGAIRGHDQPDHSLTQLRKLRVALVHYWFVQRRGGERIVEALAELFPQAHLYALVAKPEILSPCLQRLKLSTSFLQHVPGP